MSKLIRIPVLWQQHSSNISNSGSFAHLLLPPRHLQNISQSKKEITEIQDRLITTCQTWFVSCLISKGDFYQFIHLWDRLIVYSRLVPQNIWASQGGISIKHWAFYNWHPLVYNLRINTMRICYLLIRVLRMFGVRVMVKRCESDDSKMWEWWISFWRRKRRGKARPGKAMA